MQLISLYTVMGMATNPTSVAKNTRNLPIVGCSHDRLGSNIQSTVHKLFAYFFRVMMTDGSDGSYRGCAYTVLQTVQIPGALYAISYVI